MRQTQVKILGLMFLLSGRERAFAFYDILQIVTQDDPILSLSPLGLNDRQIAIQSLHLFLHRLSPNLALSPRPLQLTCHKFWRTTTFYQPESRAA